MLLKGGKLFGPLEGLESLSLYRDSFCNRIPFQKTVHSYNDY